MCLSEPAGTVASHACSDIKAGNILLSEKGEAKLGLSLAMLSLSLSPLSHFHFSLSLTHFHFLSLSVSLCLCLFLSLSISSRAESEEDPSVSTFVWRLHVPLLCRLLLCAADFGVAGQLSDTMAKRNTVCISCFRFFFSQFFHK